MDPIGAILISIVIFVKWMHVGMDHANKIVGRRYGSRSVISRSIYHHPNTPIHTHPPHTHPAPKKIHTHSAPPETLEVISELAQGHHPQLELDIIRAYQCVYRFALL